MSNHISTLEIRNFKSIKHVQLADCAKINVIIGKPNVGKSNILEALSLLGEHSGERFFSDMIHYETMSNLFYDSEFQENISVVTNLDAATIRFVSNENHFVYFQGNKVMLDVPTDNMHNPDRDPKRSYKINNDGQYNNNIGGILKPHQISVRNYSYRRLTKHDNPIESYLLPPFGANLLAVLRTNAVLRDAISPMFGEYGLELVLDVSEKALRIQKKKNGLVYSLPYSLVADTLQRVIFYVAAMYSNTGSVLLFEEPEAHTFPPYIKMLADYMVLDDTNQFFVTTHSPYFLDTIIERTENDYAVFIANFVNGQTVLRRLTEEQVQEVYNLGDGVFANIYRFLQ